MGRIDVQGQALVDEYLACLGAKHRADENLKLAKEKLLVYSQEKNKKSFITKTGSVTVSLKRRTVFPKYNQPGRRELEQAVKESGYWQEAQSFDVVKLAEAYDDNRLPDKLKESLSAWAKADRQIRIFINET